MAKYKVVPVEITDDMAEASGCEGCFRKSVHDQAQDMWTAMLNVSPDVQGEPVAITDADILAIAGRVESCPVSPWWLKDDVAIGDVRAAVLRFARALLVAAPQPAEQQPTSHDWDDQDKCRRCGDRDWYASATCSPKQQPDDRAYLMDKQCREAVAAALDFIRGGDYEWSYLLQQIKDTVSASEKQPTPDVAQLVEALEEIRGLPSVRQDEAAFIAGSALATYRNQGDDQ